MFVCAVTIRAAERTHGFHRVMHSYVEQLERLLTVVILVLLGGAIARGLLAGIGWTEVLVALAFLLLVRPLAGWLGLARGKTGPRERIAISFFGIRGIGSLYYLAYALGHGNFGAQAEQLWAFVGLVVAMSIVLHGATTAPVMNRLDRLRQRRAVGTAWRRGRGAVHGHLSASAAAVPLAQQGVDQPRGHLGGAAVDVEPGSVPQRPGAAASRWRPPAGRGR